MNIVNTILLLFSGIFLLIFATLLVLLILVMCGKDIIVWYPLKCNDKYVPMNYSFIRTITLFSDTKDAFDFIKKSFLTEEKCSIKCNELNKNENRRV